jgi:hypothetical protein
MFPDEDIQTFTLTLSVTGSAMNREALRDLLEPIVEHCTAAEAIETGLDGAGVSTRVGLMLNDERIDQLIAGEEAVMSDFHSHGIYPEN